MDGGREAARSGNGLEVYEVVGEGNLVGLERLTSALGEISPAVFCMMFVVIVVPLLSLHPHLPPLPLRLRNVR